MLEIFTNAIIEKESITLFGTLDEKEQNISLRFPADNPTADKLRDIIYQKPTNVYGCKFLSNTTHFRGIGAVSNIEGVFFRAIKEDNFSQRYDTVSFSFTDIDKFFPLESFVTEVEKGEGGFSISRGKSDFHSFTLSNGALITIRSEYDGVFQSSKLYNLDITQTKMIKIIFPNKLSVEELLDSVVHVKQYFEFICKQEILLEKIDFTNSDKRSEKGKLISDNILIPKTHIKRIKEKPYKGTPEELIGGLDGWLSAFDTYKDVFAIWEKTIYNANVSQDDLFIWNCQAFELLCTLEPTIFAKANTKKAKNQTNPNLKNFMMASSEIYDLTPKLDTQYYADVKEVRDKLTHNNPQKIVTDEQKKNSYCLIRHFFDSTIEKILNISNCSHSLILTTHSKGTFSK